MNGSSIVGKMIADNNLNKTKNFIFKKRSVKGMDVYSIGDSVESNYYPFNDKQKAIDFYYESRKKGFTPQFIPRENPYVITYEPLSDYSVADKLPGGIYDLAVVDDEWVLVSKDMRTDGITFVPKISLEIENKIKHYLSKKEVYDNNKIPFRTSYLLYGPPGTGKTTLLRKLMNDYNNDDYISIFIDTPLPIEFIKALNEDPRTKIIICEELTTSLNNSRSSKLFLDFLDGETSLNNVITIATTNYPQNLPENLVNRRGRFDRFYEIDKMSKEDNKKFAEQMLKRTITEEEHNCINELNISEIKDLCMTHIVEGLDFKHYIKELQEHKRNYENYFAKYKKMGL